MNRRYESSEFLAIALAFTGLALGQVPSTNGTSDGNSNTGSGSLTFGGNQNLGSDNTAVGSSARLGSGNGVGTSTGNGNTALGASALMSFTSGSEIQGAKIERLERQLVRDADRTDKNRKPAGPGRWAMKRSDPLTLGILNRTG